MRIPFVLAAAILFAAPAAASPDWAHAARADVKLASFSFTPSTIHLRAGQPVVLHLVNTASGGHDFSAPAFFEAADVRAEDRGKIDDDGSVDLHGHQSAEIALVPKAGHYPLRCTHAFHKTFGMSGIIVVD
jgi:uncharacterized cupredoxin-like copper-binding protein